MASKRSHSTETPASPQGEPSSKRTFVAVPPVNLGSISTEEELDIKIVKFQNAKLFARLKELKAQEEDHNTRVHELEQLRANDQTIISVLNRAWNQLDEDVCVLLQRFEEIKEDEEEFKAVGETTVAFLERLSNRTTKSMQEETDIRRSHSSHIITRLVTLVDRTVHRGQNMCRLLTAAPAVPVVKLEPNQGEQQDVKREDSTECDTHEGATLSEDAKNADASLNMASIELAIRDEIATVKEENQRLHALNTTLHDKYNAMSTEFSELHDKHAASEKDVSELTAKSQDMEYDLQKAHHQVEKLISRLNEMQERGGIIATAAGKGIPLAANSAEAAQGAAAAQADERSAELEEQKELAQTRLAELEKLQDMYKNSLKECEQLRFESKNLTEDAVLQSPTYKSLQVKFTMLYNDAQQIRGQAEDARRLLTSSRGHHLMQMEQLDNDASSSRKKVRHEVGQLEKTLTETRRELELLRVEYEHNMKAHEQIGPMAKEMRHLINSLQNHNQQLKGEVMRYKRKLDAPQIQEGKAVEEKSVSPATEKTGTSVGEGAEMGEDGDGAITSEASAAADAATDDVVKDLTSKLKQSRESEKELRVLLDVYKSASKETREKTELLTVEKSLRDEIEQWNVKMDSLNVELEKRKQELTSDEAVTKMKQALEKVERLEKSLTNTKQEGHALVAEMEFTGQAFEEMQEQNIRLMQQLREKDDANLKLMSERIKANQLQKLMREEKEALVEQLSTFAVRQHSLEDVIKRLEEREKVLQSALQSVEKETSLRQQASEMHKRKAIEAGQQVQELTFRLESIQNQVDKIKDTMIDKNNRLEEESFKCRRMEEENTSLKRKLDKAKKMEYLGASDEILVEEVKMYKAKLTCPCCNTRRKDAILTKCFHVFCFECLKTRYDTRQRKCPKCNATFGNNDFHKIYM